MKKKSYQSMDSAYNVNRRIFLKTGAVTSAGLVLGTPHLWAGDQSDEKKSTTPKKNIDSVNDIPPTKSYLPGLFPGKVVEVHDAKAMAENKPNAGAIDAIERFPPLVRQIQQRTQIPRDPVIQAPDLCPPLSDLHRRFAQVEIDDCGIRFP